MILYKEYAEINSKGIKFTISFNKDKYNWATSEPRKVGYSINAVPVESSNNGFFEVTTAFTGFNDCLLEIDR